MEYEEVIARLGAIRQKLESDLSWDNYRDDRFVAHSMRQDIEALEYAIKMLKEQQ